MLLWIPKAPKSCDDDEKAAKLQRQARARAQKTINFLGLLCVLFFLAITQLDDRAARTPDSGLRSRTSDAARIELLENVERDEFLGKKSPSLPDDSIYNLEYPDSLGETISLKRFAGQITLVVNTASKWGKTKLEYHQLAVLHEDLQAKGFSVLAFPSNDFHQELETNEEIHRFWQQEFPEATFPVFAESSLRDNPIYQCLRNQLPGKEVRQNFFKYLVGRDGLAIDLFTKMQDPETLRSSIEELLAAL